MSLLSFIQKAKSKHGEKYDYSKVSYSNSTTPIEIICKKHGSYIQKPYAHITGNGCSKCSNNKKSTTNEFIEKAKQIHSVKYNYFKVLYKNAITPVIIICKKHGEFKQKPNNHLNGQGCPNCGKLLRIKKKTLSQKIFIQKALNVHNKKYDYLNTKYQGHKNLITITCKIHGDFIQKANTHLNGHGCPKCNQSKAEIVIEEFLKGNGIPYQTQYRFKECRNIRPLPFDFYLPNQNLCIEYDGAQHFKNVNWLTPNSLEEIKKRDAIKSDFCIKNNINLLRIAYIDYEKIITILEAKISKNQIP